MALMTDKHVRHLPVVVAETVVGVISIGDVVRGIIDDKESLIQQLTTYINRRRLNEPTGRALYAAGVFQNFLTIAPLLVPRSNRVRGAIKEGDATSKASRVRFTLPIAIALAIWILEGGPTRKPRSDLLSQVCSVTQR